MSNLNPSFQNSVSFKTSSVVAENSQPKHYQISTYYYHDLQPIGSIAGDVITSVDVKTIEVNLQVASSSCFLIKINL